MCEFVSWIEHKGVILFLEDKDLQGKAGKELRDFCQNKDDLSGHGAIRYVYSLDCAVGEASECTDFSSPAYFPDEIVAAIKELRMTMFGTPEGLLSAPALEQYKKVKNTAWEQYEKVENTALEQYETVARKEFWRLFAVAENRASAWKKGCD